MVCIEDLPLYLQKSIREYIEHENDALNWDIYADDLYGSINSAQHDGNITLPEANELREQYLGLKPGNI